MLADDCDDVRRRLLDALDVLLEVIDAPEMLNTLDAHEKSDFFNAAGDVFCPDPEIRRRRTKLLQQQRRAAKIRRDDAVLTGTGIRTLRAKPVFTTPDVFAPVDVRAAGRSTTRPRCGRASEPQHCYVCKQQLSRGPPLLRPAVPAVRASSTSPSAPSWPTCAGASRCSPAGG